MLLRTCIYVSTSQQIAWHAPPTPITVYSHLATVTEHECNGLQQERMIDKHPCFLFHVRTNIIVMNGLSLSHIYLVATWLQTCTTGVGR